jgi:hypothetical protein
MGHIKLNKVQKKFGDVEVIPPLDSLALQAVESQPYCV